MSTPLASQPRTTPAPISPVEEIVAELRDGRMVILVDEEDRENEGDLLLAADHVTPEAINFMARYGRGLVCLTLTPERCRHLGLSAMVANNGTKTGTAFTASIEAARGVTTGISAADRCRTVQAAVARDAVASDLVQPGHIFPLQAVEGGVLMRAGHTEAGCDLAAMAGCSPAAIICEIMKDDGEMARLADLQLFAATHHLRIGTIVDLIAYRSATESLIALQHSQTVCTPWGPFEAHAYTDKPSGQTHLALVRGTVSATEPVLVRVQQSASLLDVLDMQQASESWTLAAALQKISEEGTGVLVLLHCGETAQELLSRFRASAPPPPAPHARGAAMDLRTYGIGAQILHSLGVHKMTLMSTPRRLPNMSGFNLEIAGYLARHSPDRK